MTRKELEKFLRRSPCNYSEERIQERLRKYDETAERRRQIKESGICRCCGQKKHG